MPVTQCAAVKTNWSPISAPPQAYCILPSSPLVYPKRVSQGYAPTMASSPPTMNGVTPGIAWPQDDANLGIVGIDTFDLYSWPMKAKY